MSEIQIEVDARGKQAEQPSEKLSWKKPEIHTESIAMTQTGFASGADAGSLSV